MTLRMLNRGEERISAIESLSFPFSQILLNALSSDIANTFRATACADRCSSIINMCRLTIITHAHNEVNN